MKRTAVVCALLIIACISCSSRQAESAAGTLAGTNWRLVAFQSNDDRIGRVVPDNPARYTMSLGADGRVSMQLNCNRAQGSWTAAPANETSGSFAFGPLAMTRAYCPPPSMDTQIARDAEFVRTFLIRNGHLFLDLYADGGTYEWEPIAD